jgi:hypothetical protein
MEGSFCKKGPTTGSPNNKMALHKSEMDTQAANIRPKRINNFGSFSFDTARSKKRESNRAKANGIPMTRMQTSIFKSSIKIIADYSSPKQKLA